MSKSLYIQNSLLKFLINERDCRCLATVTMRGRRHPRDHVRVLATRVEHGGRVSNTVIRPVPNEKLVPDADPVHKSCDRSKTDYTFSSPSTLRQTTSVLCLIIDGNPRCADRVVRSQPGSTVLPMNQLSTASGAHCQRKEDLKYNISTPADSVISLSSFWYV